MSAATDRGAWGSRLGFILAAAGSAVGLGNIWGFPTQVGQGGGAVFVLVYLVCVGLICSPIMIAEITIGRRGQRDPVSVFSFHPDFSKLLDVGVFNAALGQAFFSLSLGMGAMITYGSYLGRHEGIAGAAMWVVFLDTLVALLAGFIIFPSGFSIPGFDPSAGGPGLIFAVLPRLFATLPGGHLFGAAFFVMLFMAALTSTVSLLEVPVAYLIDSHRWTRRRAVLTVTALTFALSIPSALGNGAVAFFGHLPVVGLDFLSLMATVWNNFALPIGGLFIALFIGWAWGVDGALEEALAERAWFPAARAWGFLVRYVCPVAIFLIIFFTIRGLF